jgi:predicted dehydrogenase
MSQGESLRVAVVGVGSLGQHHARILADSPGAVLAGVVDADPARASEIAGRHGTRVMSLDEALDAGLDGVVVAAPTRLHREIAERFLAQGTAVLCEKPLATSVDECDAILSAAERSGAPLLAGHIEHFNPGVQALAGHVSNPGFLEVHRLGVFVPRSLDVDVILDLMIHDIEIAQSLVGRPVSRIEAVGVRVLTPFVDIANARLTFEGGCVANLTASRISRDKVRKLRVFQPQAYLSVDYTEQSVECYRVEEAGGQRSIAKVPVDVAKKEPLRCELEHFLRVVRREEKPLVDGRAAREAVSAAQAILACMAG